MNPFIRNVRQVALRLISNSTTLPGSEHFHFVFGNEACDLDSAMSALLYAWFLTKIQRVNCTLTHYVPVLNIPRDMFRLRTETLYLLKNIGISQNDLIFRDDFDLEGMHSRSEGRFKVTLVDHHVLSKSDEFLKPSVVEIIDHRPRITTFEPSVNVDIAIVGSCSTLIAERIIKALDEGRIELADEEWEDIVSMISGPIMLDTVNMKESAGKVTDRDINVIERLWKNKTKKDLSRLYEELCKAKYSTEGMTAEDLMFKDPKFIESTGGEKRVMFSTIHGTLGDFLRLNTATNSVPSVTHEEGCHLWVALLPEEPDEIGKCYKPVILFSEDDKFRKKVEDALNSTDNPSLDLKLSKSTSTRQHYTIYRMYNVKASRKQILPIVVDFIG